MSDRAIAYIPRSTSSPTGAPRIGIFVSINLHYDIETDLVHLKNANIGLERLHLVRRRLEPGQRRHLGRFKQIDGDDVLLSEAPDSTRIELRYAKLEGSKENFSRCIRGLLRHRARSFHTAMNRAQAAYQLGPDFDKKVEKVGKYLITQTHSTRGGLASSTRSTPNDYERRTRKLDLQSTACRLRFRPHGSEQL